MNDIVKRRLYLNECIVLNGFRVASPSVQGHVHLRLDGWFDSPRAFLAPPPDFLSVAFFPPPEELLFFPFFTTSHLPNEPLLEAISLSCCWAFRDFLPASSTQNKSELANHSAASLGHAPATSV